MNSVEPQQWATKYHCYLYKVALSKINDAEQANDLVQDTFLAGLERLSHFKGNSTEKTWLTGILLHKIMDQYRRQRVQQNKEGEVIAAHIYRQATFTHEEVMIQKEFLTGLKDNLAKMPNLWAKVFQLKYLEDAPTEVICKQLELTAANFWTISHRSRLRLRDYLQNAG